VSEASVYRLLEAVDLIASPAFLALKVSGLDQATVVDRPRLLSDNGSSYIAADPCSRITSIICSSVNRFRFIVRSFFRWRTLLHTGGVSGEHVIEKTPIWRSIAAGERWQQNATVLNERTV
jgi:hypothetical protein